MNLQDIIISKIKNEGALTVDEYMALCLQHEEYGYYRHAAAVGAGGDFVTAPEISQIFGDLLGLWIADICRQMLANSDISDNEYNFHIALVELGPGRGTLMADIMRMLEKQPDIINNISIHLLEINDRLRQQQQQNLARYNPVWHSTIDSLPADANLLIIANEFFDALPIRQWVGACERKIAVDGADNLYFTPDGVVTKEQSPQAIAIMQKLAKLVKRQGGAGLIIDYGYIDNCNQENCDTLQAVRQHQYCHPLQYCGAADLTAHVDFGALCDVATEYDLHIFGPISQGKFLQKLGGDIWLQKLLKKAASRQQQELIETGWLRLISPAEMGSLFRVMAFVEGDALKVAGFDGY